MKQSGKSAVDIIEVTGVSLPEEQGAARFGQAKKFIKPYAKVGQTITHLINQLIDHQIYFERARETEDNSILPDGLTFRNYWYRFGQHQQDVALLQCVVRTVGEIH